MNTETLKLLIKDNKSTRQIAVKLGVGQATVRYWLRKNNLKTIPRSGYRCKCGETDPSKFYGNKKRICSECHNSNVIRLGHEKRLWAIEYLGGECCNKKCAYNKYKCALDVHHTVKEKKDPNFSS